MIRPSFSTTGRQPRRHLTRAAGRILFLPLLLLCLLLTLALGGCAGDGTEAPDTTPSAPEDTSGSDAPPVYADAWDPATTLLFGMPNGIYDENTEIRFSVAPSQPVPEGYTIFFTSDGREPTKRSNEYEKPFTTLQRGDCITFRAAIFDPDGNRVSRIYTTSYVRSRDNRFDKLPVVVLTAKEDDLNGSDGIFSNPTGSGKEWERVAHIELFAPGGGVWADQDGGIRVFGGSSRTLPQKSLKLIARRDGYYDATKYTGRGSFAAEIFPGRKYLSGADAGQTVAAYDRLILRNGGNDSMQATAADPLSMTLLRDNVSNNFAAALLPHLPVQTSRMAAVFLNGKYYGILDMKEDCNDNYLRNLYGLPSKEEAVVIKSELDTTRHCSRHDNGGACRFCNVWFYYETDEGREGEIDRLTTLCQRAIDAGEEERESVFREIEAAFDLDNLREYMALNLYLCNTDWPHNNVRVWRWTGDKQDGIPETDGRFRFTTRDMDFAIGRYECEVLPEINTQAYVDTFQRTFATYWGEDTDGIYPDSLLLQGLFDFCLHDDGFRAAFIETCRMLASADSSSLLSQKIADAAAEIAGEIPYHLERWASTIAADYTAENWEEQVEWMQDWAAERPTYFLAHLEAAMTHYE